VGCCLDWAGKPLDRTSVLLSYTHEVRIHVPDSSSQDPDDDDDLLPVIVTFATVAKEKSSN